MTDAEPARPVAALTGGTGFIGQHVAAALAAAGWKVRLLCRRDIVSPRLADVTPELVLGDLADPAALRRLVAGATAVVHLAGLTKARNRDGFMQVNRDGTALLSRTVAAENPAARCVLVSSLAAREPALSAYAASKRAGEDVVGPAWTILRPGVVYGPGDQEGRALQRLARAPFAARVRAPAVKLAMVHATDLAEAIAALCADDEAGGRYEIADHRPEGYGMEEILHLVAELLGRRPPRMVTLPDQVFNLAGMAADGFALATGRQGIFGYGKTRELLHRDWSVRPGATIPRGLWSPRISLAAGMQDTLRWWQTHSSRTH
ncbi:NAD-dependent epimerase/dehydratase family protein [Roseomonas haemaphysalidis]|uniref:SDR family NAD(P)-dependent oxidoreductase n=1 Tax=Roseomonas haemaphysalidis TaxID=2768162 RepID=A0ABS3KKS4_9PROT|nr:SDR family NAD(P)-dependent oxidoreductase [Roseomonas haemaphysalidis]MBO1078057.1 SDR family NAD(P)-dependent oxidoreductase [Roseomonas haemaphysalidis]